MQRCDECGLEKPKDAMCRLYRGRLRCKACKKAGDLAATKKWKEENRPRVLASHSAYFVKLKSHRLAQARALYQRRRVWPSREAFEEWCRQDDLGESMDLDRSYPPQGVE